MIRHKNSYHYHKIVLVKDTTWSHNVKKKTTKKKKTPKHKSFKTLRDCKKKKVSFLDYIIYYIHVEKENILLCRAKKISIS